MAEHTTSVRPDCIFTSNLTAEERAVLRFLQELSDAEIDYADTPALAEQTAQQIVDFEFPEDEQARIYELVARDPSTLSHEEELELGLFLYIEQVLVILKLRSMRLVDR